MTDSIKNGLYDQLFLSLDTISGSGALFEYQDDPTAFGEDVLNETYTEDVKALMESVRDNTITIAKSANATGKTHSAARIAIWFYKVFHDAQVYTGAAPPESNLKKLLWGEIGSIIEKHPDLFKPDKIKDLQISKSSQSFIAGVTIPSSGTPAQREAQFSGKHAPYLLFILDEADAIPDEVYRGIESCMSGGHVRLLLMFNPRAESGEAFRMERDGRGNIVHLSAFNHPNVITGQDIIPGAVTQETTIRRINQWCRPLSGDEKPDTECFKIPSFLEGLSGKDQAGKRYPALKPGYYKIMESAFSYMVLGQYPAQGSTQLINREWTSRARSRWDAYVLEHGEKPPVGSTGIMGLDVGEFGTDVNAACFRYGGWTERIIIWSGIDTIATGDRASDEFHSRKLIRANVDGTGVGTGVAPQMKRNNCKSSSVKVASSPTEKSELGEFFILRDQLWWACREWLRTDPGAMLPPDNGLIEELLIPTYEVVNGKIRIMKKLIMRELLKRSPDRADALCLTFFKPELLFPNIFRKE